jgi:hypothetical protein
MCPGFFMKVMQIGWRSFLVVAIPDTPLTIR